MGELPAGRSTRDFFRSFPRHPTSAAAVRGFVREGCADALAEGDLDAAVLLANELVANAVLHTESQEIEVHIQIGPERIRIGVRDDDYAPPAPSAPSQEKASGRGLQLVERLAKTWGVNQSERGGKWVWFSLCPLRGSRPDP